MQTARGSVVASASRIRMGWRRPSTGAVVRHPGGLGLEESAQHQVRWQDADDGCEARHHGDHERVRLTDAVLSRRHKRDAREEHAQSDERAGVVEWIVVRGHTARRRTERHVNQRAQASKRHQTVQAERGDGREV